MGVMTKLKGFLIVFSCDYSMRNVLIHVHFLTSLFVAPLRF